MKPLLLSSIANTESLFTQSIPPSALLNLTNKSYLVNCPKCLYNLPCKYYYMQNYVYVMTVKKSPSLQVNHSQLAHDNLKWQQWTTTKTS